jgi:hypothetical protein
MICGVFIAEDDGEGDNGQEIPQQLMYRHSWRPYEHGLRPFFLVKSKTSSLVTILKCWIIRISEL